MLDEILSKQSGKLKELVNLAKELVEIAKKRDKMRFLKDELNLIQVIKIVLMLIVAFFAWSWSYKVLELLEIISKRI